MLKFWKKKQASQSSSSGNLTWDPQASQALEQSLAQAPVPKMMKSMVKSQLKKAAEDIARKANRTTVTAQDLMEGMLSRMPAHMRAKVEDAIKQGPEGLEKLKKDLGRGKTQ